MKKRILTIPVLISFLAILFAGLASFTSTKKSKPINRAGLVWADTLHDFGKMNIGPELIHTFKFKNKTSKVVAIKTAEPGCSCTVSEFTQDPISKGKSGTITAKYNTKGRMGFFKKFIHVTFADGKTQELVITGDVVSP